MPDYTTAALVMERLRLTVGNIDEDYITDVCTPAGNNVVDVYLGRTDPASSFPPLTAPYPPELVAAATSAAERFYFYKNTSADTAEAWGDQAIGLHVPRDPLAGNREKIAHLRNPSEWCPQ